MSNEMSGMVKKSISYTLTNIAFEAQKDLKIQAKHDLHLTRPFLTQQIQFDKSEISTMKSVVGITDKVKFADLLVKGGDRHPDLSRYIAIPIKAKGRNKSKPGAIRKLLAKRGYFLREIHGVLGIWKTNGNSYYLNLMYKLVLKSHYDKPGHYLHWNRTVENAVRRSNFERKFFENLERQLRR
jgi:hypothetical protein